jgi:hypothetical protein
MKKQIVQSSKRPQGYVSDDRIATGQDKARAKGRKLDMRSWWKIVLTQNGWIDALKAFNTTMPLRSTPTLAFINHGRWVALCPEKDCAGQEVVDPLDPVFMCLSCGNVGNSHGGMIRFHPVKFPKDRYAIEEVLLKRKAINRNWNSDKETLDDLIKENKEYGLVSTF